MGTTAFISDLHLDAGEPAIAARLFAFLEDCVGSVERLFILGDLFEAWIGDDEETELAAAVADRLAALAAADTDLYFMAGNRDFLLGSAFAARCRMRLLKDPAVVLIGDAPLVLSHGDCFCTDDVDYQAFRQMVRDPTWIRGFLDKPLEERRAFAAHAREESRRQTGDKPAAIMDTNAGAIGALMGRLDAPLLLHGHTHRPGVHDEPEERCRRFVLGDWSAEGGVIALSSGSDLALERLS
ncbi:MAG: UDP-2,3-diacylglucosamine diphosphatase [Pseudomonadota bacterium]